MSIIIQENGRAVVYVRPDVKPHDLADEAIHLIQLNDPKNPRLGESMRMLGEATAGNWSKMDLEMRKHLFERKLEVEIDAKHRRLAELRVTDPEWKVVNDQLVNLNKLQIKSTAITPEQLQLMKASPEHQPDFLKDPAWLFAKNTNTTAGINMTAPGVDVSSIKTHPVKDSPASKLDPTAKVTQVGEPWSNTTVVTATNGGTVKLDGPNRVLIDGRAYVLEDGATLHVKDGQKVDRGTPLATEKPETYRLVKVEKRDGTTQERLEYKSAKRGGWVLAGEQSSRRGMAVEKAARDQLTAELDVEKKLGTDPMMTPRKDRLTDWMRIPHQNAQGQGFDDVVVEFRGDPPTAKIRIIEVKDYPNRNVSLGEMSAIRENLVANMRRLRLDIAKAVGAPSPGERPAAFRHLTKEQVEALRDAALDNHFRIELRIGETTSIGPESRSNSVLGKLRAELQASDEFRGADVLATEVPKHVDPKYVTGNPSGGGNSP